MSDIRFGKYRMNLPGSRWLRTGLGALLVFAGMLGFLPILGFWMIPLGLMVLAIDYHPIRRLKRRFEVWRGRRVKPKPKM